MRAQRLLCDANLDRIIALLNQVTQEGLIAAYEIADFNEVNAHLDTAANGNAALYNNQVCDTYPRGTAYPPSKRRSTRATRCSA